MVNWCCVPNCKNTENDIKLHRFPNPKSEKLFKKWIKNIGNPTLENKDPKSIYSAYRVCDVHFASENRIQVRSGSSLRSDSVPTLYLPEMDPLSISLLEGMDQIEVVIDSDEDEHSGNEAASNNEDTSSNEMEEQDDYADEEFIPENMDTTSSNDVEIIESEPRSKDTEGVPSKKLKISNIMSLNTVLKTPTTNSLTCSQELRQNSSNDVEIIDYEPRSNDTEGVPSKKLRISNIMSLNTVLRTPTTNPLTCSEELPGAPLVERPQKAVTNESNIKQASSSHCSTAKADGTRNIIKPSGTILLNQLMSGKENSGVTSTPAGVPTAVGQKSVSVIPLVVPGGLNVLPTEAVPSANINTVSEMRKVVILPNQQEFPLEEDTSRTNPCFVPGCKIYKNEQMYAFAVPHDKATLQVWEMCINNRENKLDFNHVICYKHFAQEDVIHNIKIVNKNGQDIAVDEPKLRKGALPCVKFWEACCVPNCGKTNGRMFTFPVSNKSNLHLWLYLIKNLELKKLPMRELMRHRVCETHFESDSFDDVGALVKSAAPTLFLPESSQPILPQMSQVKYNLGKRCAFKDCSMSTLNSSKQLFTFPQTFLKVLTWLGACNRPDLMKPTLEETLPKLSQLGVCELHFDFNDFHDSMMTKLKDSAVPKKLTCAPKPANKENAEQETQPLKLTPIMMKSCLYRGCSNKTTDNKQFFFFPTNLDRYQEWMTACGYRDCSTFYAFRICRDHFTDDMFDESGWLLDTAKPVVHPNPKLVPLTTPVFHPKKFSNPEIDSQTIRTKDKVETRLTFGDKREVRIIQENPTSDAQEGAADKEVDLLCAVRSCMSVYKGAEGKYHKFPDPKTDFERHDLWLKLVANTDLAQLSKQEICRSYMVCMRHFEKRFYSRRLPNGQTVLSKEAVPTLNLPADSCLLKEWDFYKDKLKKYMDGLAAGVTDTVTDDEEEVIAEEYVPPQAPEPKPPVITSWVSTDAVRLSDLGDKTRCLLEKNRLSFPGMGCNLNITTTDAKRKVPYSVYRAGLNSYGLTNDFEIGESLHVHTAIIIDDDDESERIVLQQLLEMKKKARKRVVKET